MGVRSGPNRFRHFSWLLLGALCLPLLGCQGTITKPPASTEKRAERTPARPDEPTPHHVAPPPAYGNKVVLRDTTEGGPHQQPKLLR